MENNLFVTVGTPGTGKSYQLIQKVIELEKQGLSYYIMTPTKTAKERLLSGFREVTSQGKLDREQFFNVMKNIHILQYSYRGEDNILIDEFSMIQIDDWYSLLYKMLLINRQINVYAYGDSKQLPPVQNVGALLVLLKTNYKNFLDIGDMNFSEYSANRLYSNLKDMKNLDVPANWKLAINHVELKVLHKNYRLKALDGVADYDDNFYRYMLDNNIIENDYVENLVSFIKEKYLVVVPTYKIGRKVDELASENLIKVTDDKTKNTIALSKIAPFIRKDKTVYINPKCEIDYGFQSFVPECTKEHDLTGFKFSFFTITHNVQGATVDNMVFVIFDHEIDKKVKEFYSNNMLYTALSRAKYHSYFLGKETTFLQMQSTYVETDTSYINTQLAEEALKETYEQIVNAGNFLGRLTNDEILETYKNNFDDVVKNNQQKIIDVQLANKDFKPKPFSDRKVIGVMNISKSNEFTADLIRLGYGFHHLKWQKEQLKNGNSKGGKATNGAVKNWVNSLNDDFKQQVKDDLTLSQRKFQNKYHKSKSQVQKYI